MSFFEGEEVQIQGCQGWKGGYLVWEEPDGDSVQLLTPNGKLMRRRVDAVKKIVCGITREAFERAMSWPAPSPDIQKLFGIDSYTREWNR